MMPGMAGMLLALSTILFIVGLWTPVGIIIEGTPSILTYQLVMVSFPAWLLGGVLSVMAHRKLLLTNDKRQTLALILGILHAAAIVACLIWRPEGIS